MNQKMRFFHKLSSFYTQPHPSKINSTPSTKHYHCPCLNLFYSLMKVKSMCLFYWFPLCRMRDWCRYISVWIGIWCSSLYLSVYALNFLSFLHSFHFQLQLNAPCSSCINCNIQFWKLKKQFVSFNLFEFEKIICDFWGNGIPRLKFIDRLLFANYSCVYMDISKLFGIFDCNIPIFGSLIKAL